MCLFVEGRKEGVHHLENVSWQRLKGEVPFLFTFFSNWFWSSTRHLRAQRRPHTWKARNDLGTHGKLPTQVKSNAGGACDQRGTSGLEMARNWIPEISEDVHRGRLRCCTEITQDCRRLRPGVRQKSRAKGTDEKENMHAEEKDSGEKEQPR